MTGAKYDPNFYRLPRNPEWTLVMMLMFVFYVSICLIIITWHLLLPRVLTYQMSMGCTLGVIKFSIGLPFIHSFIHTPFELIQTDSEWHCCRRHFVFISVFTLTLQIMNRYCIVFMRFGCWKNVVLKAPVRNIDLAISYGLSRFI